MPPLNDTDRARLAAILGMLGSNSAGERDNAAQQAERLRRRLGKTWDDLLADRVIYVDRFIPPWPQEPPREIVREVPAQPLGMPQWAFAVWCVAVGLIVGGWGHLIAVYH
jgi:hypothetical protein